MVGHVTFTAKPHNVKWLVVVGVVGLYFFATARAWGFNQFPTLQINVGVRPAIHFLSGKPFKGMGFSPIAHVFGMTESASSSRFSISFPARAGFRSHLDTVVNVEHFGKAK